MIPPEQVEAALRKFVEKAWRDGFASGVEMEREEAAQVAEEFEAAAQAHPRQNADAILGADVASNIAAAIRSRNSK